MLYLLALSAQALTMASAAPLNWPQDDGFHAGAGAVEVLIDTKGTALRCSLSTSVGDEATVRQICPKLMARAWRPASRQSGQAAYAVYRDVVKLRRGGFGEPIPNRDGEGFNTFAAPTRSIEQVRRAYQLADFTLPNTGRDGASGDEKSVIATVLVNESGSIAGCDAGSSRGARRLREAACQALPGRMLKRQTDSAGVPVSYITTVKVSFE